MHLVSWFVRSLATLKKGTTSAFRESELGTPGVYYYKLETPTHSDRKKMILIESVDEP